MACTIILCIFFVVLMSADSSDACANIFLAPSYTHTHAMVDVHETGGGDWVGQALRGTAAGPCCLLRCACFVCYAYESRLHILHVCTRFSSVPSLINLWPSKTYGCCLQHCYTNLPLFNKLKQTVETLKGMCIVQPVKVEW